MTEIKKTLAADKATTTEAKNTIDKVSEKKLSEKKADTKKADAKEVTSKKDTGQSQPKTLSKLAIFATIIAIVAPTGHYFWQQQQSQLITEQLTNKFSQENSANFNHFQTQMQQALSTQQSSFAKQLQQVKQQTVNASQEKIAKLNDTVWQLEQRIKQRQPSDWLLHESEYLIRIAARTLWLEHDTTAAIGLLKDADARLTELNDPAFLPVRKLIHQDIKSLELMPTLQTDEVILTLMALSKQIAALPLAIESLGNSENSPANDFELSDNINDWQSNLAKTWQKFLDDFIRVRQRTGSIEPLIAPEQQAHLKQKLTLKVQLALWAASERKGDIYHKTLTDIEQWLNEFFAMDNDYNQRFMKALLTLQKQRVSYDYPSELASLPAIRAILNKKGSKPENKTDKKTENKTESNTVSKAISKPTLDKTKIEQVEQVEQVEQANDETNNEGEL